MAVLHLHGALAAFHPEPLKLHVASPAEAVRACLANFPGFGEAMRAGAWHVVRGAEDDGLYLDKDELAIGLGAHTELHFVPAVEGSRGAGKAIIGAIILVVAVVLAIPTGGGSLAWSTPVLGGMTTAGSLAMFGATMMLTGISQMLAPTPKMQSLESADKAKSYIFAGPTNRLEQGNVVPLIYGQCRVGSVVIAAAISNDDIAASPDAAYVTASPADSTVTSGDPVAITLNSSVSTTVGFKITDVTGGTLKTVIAGVEADVPADGVVPGNQAATIKFYPAGTPPTETLVSGGLEGNQTVTVITQTYTGGGFKVQAAVGLLRTPTGASASVTVHAPPPPGGGDNGAGGTDGSPDGPGGGQSGGGHGSE